MTENTLYYIDEEKLVALKLSVSFWGSVAQSPKATPPNEKKVLETADVFYDWLTKS